MIKLTYIGSDSWGRIVFKGNNGRFYKTTELEPRKGFNSLSTEAKFELIKNIHTTDEPDGEPDFPCWKDGQFTIANGE